MSLFEARDATWHKRYMQRHYSYRDSHSRATVVATATAALVLAAANDPTVVYAFGTNARAVTPYNWPNAGEIQGLHTRSQCYTREVLIYVTTDTWIRFVCINPVYITLIGQGYTVAQLAALGIPPTITEVEHFVPLLGERTFYPTYATHIIFRADTAVGVIYISAEGNVEGGE